MMQDLSGQKLGQYELRERLGRGGMADVYKAFQPGLERFVAIKVMLGHLATDAEFIERFRREARAVGQLRHPNIVSVFDFGIEREVYYMVMEFIRGENLKAYIGNRPHGLPLDEALRIASQIADALSYAHDAGMIHRDVKPANIIFMDDTHQQAILTDFGIAHILSQPGLTATGAMVGTPAYLSPEVASGREVDERADIYGLGIILYEMLTGRVPYEADTPMAIIMKHVNAPLPSPAEFGRELPEQVEAVVLKAMMKNPDDRYQTAAEMKAAIDSARAQLAEMGASFAPSERTEKIRMTDTPATLPRRAQEQSAARPEDKPTTMITTPPGRPPMLWIGAGVIAVLAVIVVLLLLSGGGGGQPTPTPTTVAQGPTQAIAAEVTPTVEPTEAATSAEAPSDTPTEASTATEAPTSTPTEVPPTATSVPPSATTAPTEVAAVPENVARAREAGLLSGLTPLQDAVDALAVDGNMDAAHQQVDQVLAADPQNIEALAARALLTTIDGDAQSALADADRVIELAPDSPLGYIARSEALDNWAITDYQGSLDAAQKAADLAPDNPEALWRVSRAQAHLGNSEAADDYLRRAVRANAAGYRFVNYAGDYLFYENDYEGALPYLTTRYRADESDMYALRMLVADLLHLDRIAEAYATVQRYPAVLTSPDDLSMAAFVAYTAGDFEQARDWAETARALSDEARAATYLLGLISWYADHNLDAAMGYFDQLENVDFYDDFLNPAFDHELHLDRGRILMEAGEYGGAVDAFQKALAALGDYPNIYEALADAHLALGETEAARDSLRLALQNTYDDADQQKRLLDRIRALGAAGVTVTPPPTEVSMAPARADMLSGLTPLQDQIDSLILNGQMDEARVIVISTLRTDPNNLEALVASSLYFSQTGDRQRALHDADQAIRLDPDSPLGFIARSEVLRYGNQGDVSRAFVAVQKALDRDRHNPEALWRASDIQGKLGHRQAFLDLFDQAEAAGAHGFRFTIFASENLYYQGFYERALPYATTRHDVFPGDIGASVFLAANLVQIGQTAPAYDLFRTFPRPFEHSDELSWAAYFAYRAGDYPQARSWAESALASDSGALAAHYVLGLVSWYGGHDLDQALGHFEVVQNARDFWNPVLNPIVGHEIFYDRGRVLAEAGQWDAAIDAYQHSLNKEPHVYTYEALADAYLAKGEPGPARENLQRALDMTPDNPDLQNRLMNRIQELDAVIESASTEALRAALLSGLNPLQDEIDGLILDGKWDEASTRLTQVLRDDPNNVDALVARSLYYSLNGRMSFAMTDADHALQQNPDSPMAYIARSDALLKGSTGDVSRALVAAQKALEIAPNNPEALWRASYAQAELGNWEAFLDLFNQAEAAGAHGFRFAAFASEYLYYDGQYERALPYAMQAHQAFPDDLWATLFLAANLLQVDQAGQAYDLFRNYPYDFEEAQQFAWAAYAAYQAGDVDQARAWGQAALDKDAGWPTAHYVLGLIRWYSDHNLDDALGQLDAVPDNGDFWDVLLNPAVGHEISYDRGRILADSGDVDRAIDAYNKSLAVDARTYTYEALADAYIAQGDTQAARDALQNAADSTANPDEQARLQQRIEQLGN